MGDDSFISDKVRVTGTIKWPPSDVKKFLPAIVWMFWQLLSFLPVSSHAVLKGVQTHRVLFDAKLLVITAHKEQAVFLTLTWLLYSHMSCQLLSKCEAFSDPSCSLVVRLQKMTCWLCRKRQLAPGCREERRGCSPPTSQRFAESTSRRVSGKVLLSWGGSRPGLGEQKLSRSLPGVSTLSSDWIQYGSPPVWWIYPDFTSDIPPRSHSGLPLTPINSVWDGYNKVLQMFGITDTGSALPRGYATDIWCWKVAICSLKQGIYLSGIYPRLHLCKLSGKHVGVLTWASLSVKWHGWLDS